MAVSRPATVSFLPGILLLDFLLITVLAISANGTFAEYVVAESDCAIVPIPESWSFEEAAQLGVAPFTAMQCLHETLELPSPFDTQRGPQRSILIWGGASSVGQYAIQFAKLGGFRVITTASPKNFDLVKGLGADEVFDYRDERVVEDIRAATGNALDIAFDTISEGTTPEQVTGAIGDKGGRVAIILPYESPRPDVKVKFTMAYDLLERVRSSHKLLHGFGFSDELLGVEWDVVRRYVDQDACHRQDQAKPGFSPTRRTGQCEGRIAVHARGKGNLRSRYLCAKNLKLESMTT